MIAFPFEEIHVHGLVHIRINKNTDFEWIGPDNEWIGSDSVCIGPDGKWALVITPLVLGSGTRQGKLVPGLLGFAIYWNLVFCRLAPG